MNPEKTLRHLTFVHLSDIHFSKRSGDHYDLDRELRTDLERDIVEQIQTIGHPATGILVTGDIAYSGSADEYRTARQWLEHLCGLLKIDTANVWLIPGNHDVDRSVAERSRSLAALHRQIKDVGIADVAQVLQSIYRNDVDASCLFSPFAEYNRFSEPFGCEIGPKRPYWHTAEALDGGFQLSISGLNSVIVSGSDDRQRGDDNVGSLVLGAFQIPLAADKTIHMTLCHHPPDWLKDETDVDLRLNSRVKIQLFGHEHRQQLAVHDNTLRLVAGAVHPNRALGDAKAAYNVLSIRVDVGPPTNLIVIVAARVWDNRRLRFGGQGIQEVPLLLVSSPQSAEDGDEHESASPLSVPDNSGFATVSETPVEGGPSVRNIAFRYIDLPYQRKLEIAQELHLFDDSDENLRDRERFRLVLRRVQERRLWPKLLERIEKAEMTDE